MDCAPYRSAYFALCKSLGLDADTRHDFNRTMTGKPSTTDFTVQEWRNVVAELQRRAGQSVAPGRPRVRGRGRGRCGTAPAPRCGTAPAPRCGTAPAPRCGTAALGCGQEGQRGAHALPERGAHALPERRAHALPERGAHALPERRATALPITPAQLEYLESLAETIPWRVGPAELIRARLLHPFRRAAWDGQYTSLTRQEAGNVIRVFRRMAAVDGERGAQALPERGAQALPERGAAR